MVRRKYVLSLLVVMLMWHCSEKIVEPSSGLLVCPISGAVSDRMMTRAEEAQEEERCGEEGGQDVALEEEYGGEKGDVQSRDGNSCRRPLVP
jgi:putative hemolysin